MNLDGLWLVGRSFLAILAGFVTIAALVMVTILGLTRIAPGFVGENERPRIPYILFNLLFSAAYAAMGGWVTAALVPLERNPLTHAFLLAIVMLLLGALSAMQMRGRQPIPYQIALTALAPVAVLLGGLLRMHQLGYKIV